MVEIFDTGYARKGRKAFRLRARMRGSRALQLATKRLFDIAGSLILFVMLWPLLIGLALWVKASGPGTAIFRQERTGWDEKPFILYKFRTLDADGRPRGPGAAFLRRSGLDELPQLLNVLRGDMALVGPRPHETDMVVAGVPYAELAPLYRLRHAMRPGITGWAQAHGLRGPLTDAETARARIAHDLAYVENFSLWLDLKILWRTLVHELPRGLDDRAGASGLIEADDLAGGAGFENPHGPHRQEGPVGEAVEGDLVAPGEADGQRAAGADIERAGDRDQIGPVIGHDGKAGAGRSFEA